MSKQAVIPNAFTASALSPDRPISDPGQDELGFAPFADMVSRSIHEMVPPEGLVISLEAPWGSGKSSALELISKALVRRALGQPTLPNEKGFNGWTAVHNQWTAKNQFRSVEIIRFNPWMFTGRESLVSALFNQIGAVAESEDSRIAEAVARVRDNVEAAGSLVGGAVGAAVSHGVATSAGATFGKAAGSIAKKLFPPDKSLHQAKELLALELSKSRRRYVVIVDDIDRLLPVELRSLLSAIKAIGDLPNIVYLLAFDREAVVASLNSGPEPIQEAFLDKIIQVHLNLPPPSSQALQRLCLATLNTVVGAQEPPDIERWAVVFRLVSKLIVTPRDVARLGNAMRVVWPALRGDVDITDLVALTVLQLFRSKIYAVVVNNIETIAGSRQPFLDKAKLAQLIEGSCDLDQTTKEILAHVFPRLAEGWRIAAHDRGTYLSMRQQRRAATVEYHRNYFAFARNPQRLSREEIDAIVASPVGGVPKVIARLAAGGGAQIPEFLEQIIEEVSQKPCLTPALTKALLSVSDTLIDRQDVILNLFPETNARRLQHIIIWGLQALPSAAKPGVMRVLESFPKGLSLAAAAVDFLGHEHGIFGPTSSPPSQVTVDRATVDQAISAITARLNAAAAHDALLSQSGGATLLWIWARMTSRPNVKSWLDARLGQKQVQLRLAAILPSTGYSSSVTGDGAFVYVEKDTNQLVDLDKLDRLLRKQLFAPGKGAKTVERYFAARKKRSIAD